MHAVFTVVLLASFMGTLMLPVMGYGCAWMTPESKKQIECMCLQYYGLAIV